MNDSDDIDWLAPWLVMVITLIGGGLRVLLLYNKGLWLDETFSIWIANHSVAELLQWVIKIDYHPPLYYLLLHYWMAFTGQATYDVRLLSAVLGAGTIPIIYLIGKRMSGAVVGLAAAVILAVSPFNIRFAQETRMYTLLTFNAAVAIYALVRLLTDPRSSRPIGSQFWDYLRAWLAPAPLKPNGEGEFSYSDQLRGIPGWIARVYKRRWIPIGTIETDLSWVAFILFSAATMLSHNSGVLFPVATNIFVFGLIIYQRIKKPGQLPTLQAPSFGNWVKAQVGIILLWSPWLPAFIRQASRVYQEFWIPKPGWQAIIQTLGSFLNEFTPGKASPVAIIWILYGLVLILGVVNYRKRVSQFLFLAVLFTIPFVGELVVSIRRPIFVDRTLIWTTIPLFLVLAAGVAQLRFRFLIILMVGILGMNNIFYASDYYRFLQKEDWSNPAGFVANFAQKGDLILFNATQVQIPFDYYFKPYEEQYFLEVERHGLPVDLFDSGIREPKMTESDIPRLLSLLQGHSRVWLVYSHSEHTDPNGLIPKTLASVMKLFYTREFNGGMVQIYGVP